MGVQIISHFRNYYKVEGPARHFLRQQCPAEDDVFCVRATVRCFLKCRRRGVDGYEAKAQPSKKASGFSDCTSKFQHTPVLRRAAGTQKHAALVSFETRVSIIPGIDILPKFLLETFGVNRPHFEATKMSRST